MWPYPRIVAHRGAGILAPENTLAAMRCGHARGYRGVEFDVMLSQDGVPILMHDPELGRTVKGSGSVADYGAAQLMRMDAGSWFGTAFADERGVGVFGEAVDHTLPDCAGTEFFTCDVAIRATVHNDAIGPVRLFRPHDDALQFRGSDPQLELMLGGLGVMRRDERQAVAGGVFVNGQLLRAGSMGGGGDEQTGK